MTKEHESALRDQLIMVLRGDQSHVDFKSATKDFPPDSIGLKPHGAPHSAWQLLEHLRIAQHDILEFSRNPKHKSPKWPEGYWPKSDTPPEKSSWDASIHAFKQDAKSLEDMVRDNKLDLFAAIEGGDGQTLLREVLVVAAHNSYHLGQLMFLKKTLSARS
jgi:hypothetical protein